MKVLSIIIPTYNMASLLPRCLDSLVKSVTLPKLDIIVVNDGSTDNSLEVAQSYAATHPEIQIIDKANGNYGSTINAALPHTEGKYVKILDSDDWFDTDSLDSYVNELETRSSDISVTHFNIIHSDGSIEVAKYNVYGREPYEYGKVYGLDKILSEGYVRFFLMHSLAYRTELLRSIGYRQTEGISYTDIEWDTYPLFQAKTIVFHDYSVYQYNLARDGQTMDPKVISRSLPQQAKMTESLIDHFKKADISRLSPTRLSFLKQLYRNRFRLLAKSYLMDIPREDFNADEFSTVDIMLKSAMAELGISGFKLYPANKIIRIDAYRYWGKHHSRLPKWIESLNVVADSLAQKVYRKIFR